MHQPAAKNNHHRRFSYGPRREDPPTPQRQRKRPEDTGCIEDLMAGARWEMINGKIRLVMMPKHMLIYIR